MANLYNSKTYLCLFGFLFCFLFVAMTLVACTDTTKESQVNSDRQEQDAQFLVDAVEINMQEVQLGKLAQKKSSSPDVSDLGKRMETDHAESYKQLIALAKKKLVTIPTITTKKAQSAYDQLNKKSDNSFDKLYCSMMIAVHEDAISLFEKAISNARDAEIKAWAEATLPTLRTHLALAQKCQQQI